MNALWPRTAIATAALMFIANGKGVNKGHRDLGTLTNSRTDEIMADAAFEILTSDSTTCTGNFFIDDDLVRHKTATLDKYAVYPGEKLSDDFFVGEDDDKELVRKREVEKKVQLELPVLEEQTLRLLRQSRL